MTVRDLVRDAVCADEQPGFSRRSFLMASATLAGLIGSTQATKAQSGGPVNLDRVGAETADLETIVTPELTGGVVGRSEPITALEAGRIPTNSLLSPSDYPNTLSFPESGDVEDMAFAWRFSGGDWVATRPSYSDGSSWTTVDSGPSAFHVYHNGEWVVMSDEYYD